VDPVGVPSRAAMRRVGWLALLGGAGLTFAAQVAAPVGAPLYDGVVIQEPYRYLHPASGQPGSPSAYTDTHPVAEGTSPDFAAATTEQPPQAQLIAQVKAFKLTPGATALQVSITPVEPPSLAPRGTIAGNVYRFAVTDQTGTPLAVDPSCVGCLSMLLRAPDGTGEATLERFADGAWTTVATTHAPTTGSYSTLPSALGDFALVIGDSGGGTNLVAVGFAGLAVLVLVLMVVVLFLPRVSSRSARAGVGPSGSGRNRIPSKRKPPRRPPPSGRQGP